MALALAADHDIQLLEPELAPAVQLQDLLATLTVDKDALQDMWADLTSVDSFDVNATEMPTLPVVTRKR